jgi:hypothetical protein
VTASYIIAAVMIVPALVQVGVAEVAAHMFVFYYAVLSEVSPPTALSPFAAAAVTGGNPLRTTMLSWKYTAPAFVVPFAFTIDPRGLGLLLQAPAGDVAWSFVHGTARCGRDRRVRHRGGSGARPLLSSASSPARRRCFCSYRQSALPLVGRNAARTRYRGALAPRLKGFCRLWRATRWSTASDSFPKANCSGLTRPASG